LKIRILTTTRMHFNINSFMKRRSPPIRKDNQEIKRETEREREREMERDIYTYTYIHTYIESLKEWKHQTPHQPRRRKKKKIWFLSLTVFLFLILCILQSAVFSLFPRYDGGWMGPRAGGSKRYCPFRSGPLDSSTGIDGVKTQQFSL
jgi:hypothetical protein